MTHRETIKSLIKPHADNQDRVFQKFMLYLLDDPKYGAINHTKDHNSIKAIQGVIDLYKEWLDTGVKPSNYLWLKAREVAVNSAFNSSAWADAAWAAANAAAYANIPRSEVEAAQINKLEYLIQTNGDDELFTETDYDKD